MSTAWKRAPRGKMYHGFGRNADGTERSLSCCGKEQSAAWREDSHRPETGDTFENRPVCPRCMHQLAVETRAEELRALLPPGSTVYTILEHVSTSGMTRDIRVMVIRDSSVRDISWATSLILERTMQNGGVRVTGCGMDMGYWLVYALSHALYPDGFACIGDGCPASAHSNGIHGETHHKDGGYALRHRWL